MDGLEHRVEKSTRINHQLQNKVHSLETQNKSLLSQLRKLQALVADHYPSRLQAGGLVMVLTLSFSLFFVPHLRHSSPPGTSYHTVSGKDACPSLWSVSACLSPSLLQFNHVPCSSRRRMNLGTLWTLSQGKSFQRWAVFPLSFPHLGLTRLQRSTFSPTQTTLPETTELMIIHKLFSLFSCFVCAHHNIIIC